MTYLCRFIIRIHLFPDDWLIRSKSPNDLLTKLNVVLKLTKKLGILINWNKSDLNHQQLFAHLGMRFNLPRYSYHSCGFCITFVTSFPQTLLLLSEFFLEDSTKVKFQRHQTQPGRKILQTQTLEKHFIFRYWK